MAALNPETERTFSTADTILASPFAVVGSIGVITEQPNVYERLKKEGVVFSTVTAGKFKRTLTYAHAAGSNHLATVGSNNLGMYGGACTDLPSVLPLPPVDRPPSLPSTASASGITSAATGDCAPCLPRRRARLASW